MKKQLASLITSCHSIQVVKCAVVLRLHSSGTITPIPDSKYHWANIAYIDWVIGVWLRSHVHDWANVGVVVHLHAIFADVGPILANDLLLQRIRKVIFFHRNESGRIFVSHFNKRCTYTQQAHNVR